MKAVEVHHERLSDEREQEVRQLQDKPRQRKYIRGRGIQKRKWMKLQGQVVDNRKKVDA